MSNDDNGREQPIENYYKLNYSNSLKKEFSRNALIVLVIKFHMTNRDPIRSTA